MKKFDEYKIDCEYFERIQKERNTNNGTFINVFHQLLKIVIIL
jgi:hypothetical protein